MNPHPCTTAKTRMGATILALSCLFVTCLSNPLSYFATHEHHQDHPPGHVMRTRGGKFSPPPLSPHLEDLPQVPEYLSKETQRLKTIPVPSISTTLGRRAYKKPNDPAPNVVPLLTALLLPSTHPKEPHRPMSLGNNTNIVSNKSEAGFDPALIRTDYSTFTAPPDNPPYPSLLIPAPRTR